MVNQKAPRSMDLVQSLIDHLTLNRIDSNIFQGTSKEVSSTRVFGGQVLAQALHAVSNTVDQDRTIHSMHAYFILPGNTADKITYIVDRTRDGGSFTTRRVRGIQYGKDIFIMAASFQKDQPGLDHQIDMPKVPFPEELDTDQELAAKVGDLISDKFKEMIRVRPIEFKPVEMPDIFTPIKSKPFQHVWLRAKGTLPDDPRIHQQVLAYASDYNLLTTAMRPHKVTLKDVQLASLDHAMWFHRPFRADDWLLYALDSPSTSNSRGFTRGNIFDQTGHLVASVVQEGLVRKTS